MYRINRAFSSEVAYNTTTRKVSTLFDQTYHCLNAYTSVIATYQPTLCTKPQRGNLRYCLIFNKSEGIVIDIDVNPASGKPDIVNIFIVYKLVAFTNSFAYVNTLFGSFNASLEDKFVSFNCFLFFL